MEGIIDVRCKIYVYRTCPVGDTVQGMLRKWEGSDGSKQIP